MTKTLLLACVLAITLHSALGITAQGSDCGNGLAQRLVVGEHGWINPTPPAENVRIRQAPGGSQTDTLAPGLVFTVIDGPECFDTLSWWEIETDDGVRGWIAEGVDTRHYFVEPLSSADMTVPSANISLRVSAIVNEKRECSGETEIELGQFVTLTKDIDDIEFFYGHPSIDGGFFSQRDFWDVGHSLYGDSESYANYASDLYLTVAGPHCFNGEYLWQIAPVTPELATQLSRGFGDSWMGADNPPAFLWLQENSGGARQLAASDRQLPSSPGYESRTVVLTQTDSAPLVSPESQIAFSSGAGGGGGYSPYYWLEPSCNNADSAGSSFSVGSNLSVISTYTNLCMYLYPFSVGEAVTVSVYQPDGNIFSEYITHTEAITLTAEVAPGSFYEDSPSITKTIPTGGVRVELPDALGTAEGVWVIEASGVSGTVRRSYGYDEYREEDFDTGETRPVMDNFCDGPIPLFVLTGFEADQPLEIVLVEGDFDLSTEEAAFQEKERWTRTTGDHGELIFTTDFLLPKGLFIIADESGEWVSQVQMVNNGEAGDFGEIARPTCGAYLSPEDAAIRPLQSGEAASINPQSEVVYLSIEGAEGDLITLNAVSIDDDNPIDPAIQLFAPDGTLIAENDNATDPLYGALDSEIRDVLLTEDGLYIIRITVDSSYGNVWVQYASGDIAALAQSDNSELSSGNRLVGSLDQDGAVWTFVANVGDSITIDLYSSEFDPILELRAADGTLIAEDDDSGERTDARLQSVELLADGEYTVFVHSWGGKAGAYTIQLELDASLSADASDVEIPAPADTLPTPDSESSVSCPGAPESRLAIGMMAVQALNENPIRVRAEPKSGTTIQFLLYPDQQVTIINGPECNTLENDGNLIWWQVENVDGLTGWVAEGTVEQYFLEPFG